jgi:hypothetical protein
MKWWLLAIAAGLFAASANAAPPLARALTAPFEQRPHPARSFNLQLVQPPASNVGLVSRSGMVAQTGVGPNMQLGVGLFSVRRNRLNLLEPKPDVRVKPSRKLGLSFSWRF